jgi:aspartyl protease family protein
MNRIIAIAGVFALLAAAIPALYQNDPHTFETALRSLTGITGPAQSPQPGAAIVAAAPPRAATPPPIGRTVRLESDRRGHFTGQFRLNGRSVEALVDTGATLVAINRSTAQRIGLMLTPADFVHQVNTANGRTRAAGVVIERLQVGSIEISDVPAMVLDDEALSSTLIGMSFLGRLARFEMRDGMLVIEQ